MKHIEIDDHIPRLMLKPFRDEVPSRENITMINEEACVFVQQELVAVYAKLTYNLDDVRNACLAMKFPKYLRTSGLETQTININASPRNGRRYNKCQFTKFRVEQPKTHQTFLMLAKKISEQYRKYFKHQFLNQVKANYIGKRKVSAEYRIKGTPLTSGVINKNSALGFHRDLANTKDGISCMICLTKGITGGELILPELKIGFKCEDNYMLLFDGQRFIHGVTPIRMAVGCKGYRFTIVYYNNKGMALCLPYLEEQVRYAKYLDNKNEETFKASLYER